MNCCAPHSDRHPTLIFFQSVEFIHPLITAVDPNVLVHPPSTNSPLLSLENGENFSEMEGGDDDDSNAHNTDGDPLGLGQSDVGDPTAMGQASVGDPTAIEQAGVEHQCTNAEKAVSLQEKPAPPPQ